MDLFTPVVDASLFHRNFRACLADGSAGPRAVLQEWAAGFPDRDGKFIKEFQTTFNSSFWELYLHAAWRELGLSVDYSHHAPDFVITGPTVFNAEAVVANEASGHRPEWDMDLDATAAYVHDHRDEFLRVATIRLANALSSKIKKLRDGYKRLPHVPGKPFVICVAPFEQPGFWAQRVQAINRVLFAFDEFITHGTGDERVILAESRMEKAFKDSSAEIQLGLFTDHKCADISAVIFSNTATFGKVRALDATRGELDLFFSTRVNHDGPDEKEINARGPDYRESLLDGLHMFLNPFADVPLDLAPFRGRGIAIHRYDVSAALPAPDYPRDFLLQRMHRHLIPTAKPVVERHRESGEYVTPSRPSWPEGVLRSVPSEDPQFADHQFAHYEGWTVLVVRDVQDDDWMAQAVQRICFSTAELARANHDDVKSVMAVGHPSAQVALYAALAAIKQDSYAAQEGSAH